MAIIRRLNNLEERVKPMMDEIEKHKIELKQKEKLFNLLNLVMEERYPEHGWCKFSKEERLRIYNKPSRRGIYENTHSLIPIFGPSKDKEDRLFIEAVRLLIDCIGDELSRRKEEKYSKKIL